MEDYSATIQVTLGMSGGHAETSDVSGGSNHRSNHNDPDPTIWLRDHLLELRPLGPFTVRKTRAGDNVVEHGEDLIGQFPHEHDAVNFATIRNDGVKQWEKNVRTFPALTVVSRGTSPPRPGFNSMADVVNSRKLGRGSDSKLLPVRNGVSIHRSARPCVP
jgi:hypothetical protein